MSAQVYESDICVVGNGAVGRAAALALAQSGWKVTVLSPSLAPVQPSEEWDVRVFALNHTAHTLLKQIRVWDAMNAARIEPVTAMHVKGGENMQDGRLGFDAYGARSNELAWILENRNLMLALDAAMRFAPGVQAVGGMATGLQQHPDHACITLQDGTQIRSKLVIGADGAQSWVRGQCDIGMSYRSYGQKGVVANFEASLPHHGVAHQWFVEDLGIIALLPLPGQRVSLVWSAPDLLADELVRSGMENLISRLEHYCYATHGKLSPVLPENVQAFPLRLIRTHSLIAPRVALVGDAAHVVHPLAGHGMNLGFGDVADLVSVLGKPGDTEDCGDSRLLERYRRARKEDVLLMQLTTDGLARLFGSDLAPVRLARKAGMNLLDRLPLIKNRLISHAMGRG